MKLSAAAIAKLAELIKSTPEIRDLFEDYHDSLTSEEIKTGPAQGAHGANAERMVKQYSELAPQHGIAKEYDQVASLISDFKGVAKSLVEAMTTFKSDFAAFQNAQVTGGRTPANVEADLEAAFTALGVATAKSDEAAITKANKRIALHKCEAEIQRVVAGSGKVGAELMARFQTLKSESSEVVAEQKQDVLKETAKAEERGYRKALADIEAGLTKAEGEAKKEEATEESNKEDREASKSDALKSTLAKIAKANDSHSSDGKFGEKNGEKTEKPDEDKEKMKAELAKLTARQDEIAKALGEASKGEKSAPVIDAKGAATIRDRVMKAIDDDSLPAEAVDSARTLLQQHDAVEGGKLSKDVFARSLELAAPSVKDLFTPATTH